MAIMKSQVGQVGKLKWLTNNDLTRSLSWVIILRIWNNAIKRDQIPGCLLTPRLEKQHLSQNKLFKSPKYAKPRDQEIAHTIEK